jgi:molecular chaperone HscB
MVRCPKCAETQAPQLCCIKCGAPLGAELDAFAAFGLKRELAIDAAELERRYHELGRKVHPDRFAAESAGVRAASLKSTANLTRSYRALREPVSRGLYWLELHRHKLSEANQSVPADLAATVFAIQEQLSEFREASGTADAPGLRADVEEHHREVQVAIGTALVQLDANFAAWDRSGDEGGEELFATLKRVLARIAYLRTLMRDIGRTLELAQAA